MTEKVGGNDSADRLACAGADQHMVPASCVRQARLRERLAEAVQAMMADILEARNAASRLVQQQPPVQVDGDLVEVASSSGASDGVSDSDVELLREVVFVSDEEGVEEEYSGGMDEPFVGFTGVDIRFASLGAHIGQHPRP